MPLVQNVLCLAPYIYDSTIPEFQRNKTGLGMMVRTIASCLGKHCNVTVLTNTQTSGHPTRTDQAFTVLAHNWGNIVCSLRPRDVAGAVGMFFRYPASFSVRARYAYYVLNKGAIQKSIHEVQPDVVHIHGVSASSRVFIETCLEMNVPFAITLHGVIGLNDAVEIPRWEKEWEKTVLQIAEQKNIPVSIVGTGGKVSLCDAYGLTGRNISVIPNCVDFEKNQVPLDVRKRWNIPDDHKIVVAVGDIYFNKNQRQIAQAYELMPPGVREKTTILFIGRELDGGVLREEIYRQNKEQQMILCGFVPRNELESYYRSASLTVLASIAEGFGLSIAEGFRLGVPAVFFDDIDAAPDLYEEGAAIAVETRSTQALADAITLALEKEWNIEAIQEHSKKFDPAQLEKQYLALLNRAANLEKKER